MARASSYQAKCRYSPERWFRAADRRVGRKPVPKDGRYSVSQVRRSEI